MHGRSASRAQAGCRAGASSAGPAAIACPPAADGEHAGDALRPALCLCVDRKGGCAAPGTANSTTHDLDFRQTANQEIAGENVWD